MKIKQQYVTKSITVSEYHLALSDDELVALQQMMLILDNFTQHELRSAVDGTGTSVVSNPGLAKQVMSNILSAHMNDE